SIFRCRWSPRCVSSTEGLQGLWRTEHCPAISSPTRGRRARNPWPPEAIVDEWSVARPRGHSSYLVLASHSKRRVLPLLGCCCSDFSIQRSTSRRDACRL